MHNGIQSIDHPVVAVNDLEQAREAYERLGFTVPPRGSHIQWGTGNLCIMFNDDYLEMRGIIDASRFTMHLDSHLAEHGEGLMGVAFATDDVKASYQAAIESGIDTGELRQLTRNFEHPEGWTQPSFELFAPAADDIEGLMHVVVIQHLTPELTRRPEFLEHANGCLGVNSMSGTIKDIASCAQKMRRLLGDDAVDVDDAGVALRVPSGQRIVLRLNDAAPGLDVMTLRVSKLQQTAKLLASNGVQYTESADGEIQVAPDYTCGVTLQFTESEPS
ncbi:MAG: VOC family protein [Woeseiaceae bacterium]